MEWYVIQSPLVYIDDNLAPHSLFGWMALLESNAVLELGGAYVVGFWPMYTAYSKFRKWAKMCHFFMESTSTHVVAASSPLKKSTVRVNKQRSRSLQHTKCARKFVIITISFWSKRVSGKMRGYCSLVGISRTIRYISPRNGEVGRVVCMATRRNMDIRDTKQIVYFRIIAAILLPTILLISYKTSRLDRAGNP